MCWTRKPSGATSQLNENEEAVGWDRHSERQKTLESIEQALNGYIETGHIPFHGGPDSASESTGIETRIKQKLQHAFQRVRGEQLFDSLTRLWNRNFMDQVLEGDLKTAQREKRDLCVALIDIDGLIYLNDAFTHAGGDQFLIACASRLQEAFHPGDWVARIGGDEFLIVLHQNLEQARKRLEDFRQEIEQNSPPPQDQREGFQSYLAGRSLKNILTVSIGLTAAQLSDTLHDCITRTEIGIHQAKNQGRNQLVLV